MAERVGVGNATLASINDVTEAIVAGARERGVELAGPQSFDSIPGYGVEARVDGRRVLIGNAKLMQREGVKLDGLEERVGELAQASKMAFGGLHLSANCCNMFGEIRIERERLREVEGRKQEPMFILRNLSRRVLLIISFMILVLPVMAQEATSAKAFNGRWDLLFDLPASQPYSQVKMPFEMILEADGRVTATALGTPGLSLPEGLLEKDRLIMKGKSAFGPATLTATVAGNKLQGEWNAASFKGAVKGEKVEGHSSAKKRLAVFDDVWSQVNQRFYDPRFNGVDWKAVRSRYRPRVASSATDGQMLVIIREMLRELKSSHVGFYALSPEEALIPRPAGTSTSKNESTPITWKKLTDDIGYLRVTRFDEGASVVQLVDQAFADIGSLPSLILDLRSNPGGTLSVAMRLGDYIFREPRVVGFLATREGLRYYKVDATEQLRAEKLPVYDGYDVNGFFQALRKTGAVALRTGGRGQIPFRGRVVMLMDEKCASTAEGLLSMVKEAKAATLIGQRTAGALLSARDIKVSGGWTLRFPEADFRTLGGINVEGRGVAPDIMIEKGGGEDAELKRALEFIGNSQPSQ